MTWLDHLSSTLIASVALLIVAGVFALRSDAGTSQTSLFSAQILQRSFSEQLQIDLDNLGVGRPAGAEAVAELSDDRFSFYTAIDTLGGGALVSYVREPAGEGLYHVRRLVDGREIGGTSDVTRLDIELRDDAGRPVTVLAEAREVEVALQRLAPFQPDTEEGTHPETTGWTTTVRPFALRYPY